MQEMSRRSLIWNASSIVGATLVLPAFSNLRLSSGSALEIAVKRATCSSSGFFVAEANPLLLLVELLTAGAAIATILEFLGLRPHWSTQPSYVDAAQCRTNFQRFCEDQSRNGDRLFTDVQRSPINREIATQATQPNTTMEPTAAPRASAAVQYKMRPAVALRGTEPAVVAAATRAIKSYYDPPNSVLAANIGITGNERLSWADEYGNQPLSVLHTANGAPNGDEPNRGFILHDRRPWNRANGGRMWVHIPDRTDPADLPTFGLQVTA